MHAFYSLRRKTAISLFAGVALAACSSVDRSVDPTTGLKSAGGPNASLNANGNITICKVAGPPGVYHFHVDVTGGGTFTLPAGQDNTVTFDGTSASCWQGAYTSTNDPSWSANPSATVKVTETLIPAGAALDSMQLNDGFGNIEPSTTVANSVTITETVFGVHTVKVFNSAVPIVGCVAINAIANQAITPVTVLASGGSGGPYTFSATGLPNGLTMAPDGTISGTPTVTGTFTYTVTVTDSNGHVGTSNCSVTVNATPTADCVSLNAVQGTAMTPVTLIGSGGTGGPYTFSATGLPTGITISTGGTISGTPQVSGTYNYTITVTDKDNHSGTVNCSTTVSNAPSAGCVTIVAVQNVAITPVTMIGSGGTGGPYTFAATGLPTGLTMSTGGTISGTPSVTGTFSYTVTVTDKDGHSGTVNCSVTVVPPPTANCVAIVAVQNVAITPVTMIGSGGTGGPYTFSAVGLPTGLTMSTGGTISGTPTVSGTFNYTVTVTDKDNHTGTVNCSVTVTMVPSANCVAIVAVQNVAITPVTLVGSGGTGGPYTFSATGLPTGLSISTDGTISGTPSVSGTFNYTITVTDASGNKGYVNCSVTVLPPPSATCVAIVAIQNVAITPVTMVGSGGTGGAYTFSAVGLPTGLTMSTGGTISGTPSVSGTFNYTVTVTDNSGNKGTVNCSVTVAAPPSANCVAIVAVQGNAITPVTMIGSGGTGGPYTFSATGLPTGLTMSTTGTISGTPSVSGTFSYTVTVTDKDGNKGTVNCSVTVATVPIANCVAIVAVANVAITPVTMIGSGGVGGPYTFSATGLPTGLTMSSTGTISGTPTVTGTFTYTVTVTDKSGNTGTVNCSVTVYPAPTATCISIAAVQGVAITPVTIVGSGGTGGPYTFSATGLPAGLTISSAGVISGTPTVNGTFNYTITITDKDGHKGYINCTVVVAPPPTCPNCVTITAQQGVAITPAQVVGTGGSGGPYTFTATGLPAGLTISSSGVVSGTPTVSGTFNYTITVTDKYGHKGTFDCTVVVAPPPTCPTCVSIAAIKNKAITPTQVTGTGGAGGPYTFTATGLPNGLVISSSGVISGTPTVSGTFTYTIVVTDKNGHSGSFQCTITVNNPYDNTPPVCNVYETASPPYMSYQDGGSGIVRLDVTTNLNNNFKVQITPTPTGTTFSPSISTQPAIMPTGTVIKFPTPVTGLIKVLAYRVTTGVTSQLTVKATDASGNTVSCDPIQTTVSVLKQDNGVQTLTNISYDEHFVHIDNGGLRALTITVNGTDFNVKRLGDNDNVTVDISSAMKHNNKNTIVLTPKGKSGDTADITIGPNP